MRTILYPPLVILLRHCHTQPNLMTPLTTLKRLSKSTVAISGGCGDIGQATARRLMLEGAHVVVLDRAPRETLSADLLEDKDLAYLYCDVTDRDSVESALRQVVEIHHRLDVVIANAGMVANERFLQIDPTNLRKTMEINFFGAFNVAQLAA